MFNLKVNKGLIENRHFFGYVYRAKEIFESENNSSALNAIKYFDNNEIILLDLEYYIVKGSFSENNEEEALTFFGKTVK